MTRALVSWLLGMAVGAWSLQSRASPQGHAAVAVGICALARESGDPAFPRFCGAVRGEVLLLRQRDRDFGLGPYLGVSTASFDTLAATTGASFVLPASPTYPFVLSLAGGAFSEPSGWSPVVEAWLFWGPHSYNFHSHYAMASGLLLGYQQSLGDERTSIVSLSGQLDLEFVAIPFIAAHQWIAGGG